MHSPYVLQCLSVMRASLISSFFFTFFFFFFLILMLSCYSPTTESYRTTNLSTTRTTNYSSDQPMLLREANGAQFTCCFHCEGDCTSYFFTMILCPITKSHGLYRVVWSANKDNPVRDNAILNFTATGYLVLQDVDGSIVWTTNTAGKSVAGMNLTDTGNLVLFDDRNSLVWQSFDHPTTSLLPGKKMFIGEKLKSSISLTNDQEGMYSLQVTDKGLFAYVESNPPQAYCSWLVNRNDTNKGRRLHEFIEWEFGILHRFF
ncbi:putative bulb-type lectin domain-containing protein [Helianthus annuus]|nr:putative bulb-type lectin domain-containing protein [Helianthus annuus]